MPLSNLNDDRILSTEEVRKMLQEDVWEFDSYVRQLTNRWNLLLRASSWNKAIPVPEDRIIVKAWKEGSVFILKPEGRVCTFYPTFGFCCWLTGKTPDMPKKSGLCIEEFEQIVCKMEVDNTIKVLLEAGFILKLIVYKINVVL